MKVLIIGDSHTGALQKGKDSLIGKNDWTQKFELNIIGCNWSVFGTPFFIDNGQYITISNPKLNKKIQILPLVESENCDYIYGFCAPFTLRDLLMNQDWRKFMPWRLDSNAIPISDALLKQICADHSQYIFQMIDVFLRNKKQLFVIESPKFFKHDPIVNNNSNQLIKYFDNYYRAFIKNKLEKRCVPIVSLNSAYYDKNDFMLPYYRHENKKDGNHANTEFGELRMKEILRFLLNSKLN